MIIIFFFYHNYKQLAEEFKKHFTCLGENIEKYINFAVSIEKELIKKEQKLQKNISYRLQFIDNARFMAITLSNLVNSLTEGIHKIKC